MPQTNRFGLAKHSKQQAAEELAKTVRNPDLSQA